MKIAQDPTPFHHDYRLLDFPRVVADLGYEHIQLTPHRDLIPFFRHPKADDALVRAFKTVSYTHLDVYKRQQQVFEDVGGAEHSVDARPGDGNRQALQQI